MTPSHTRRTTHWTVNLYQFIDSRRNRPFAWGTQDCCMFASDAIKVMTRLDVAHDLRGKYENALGAKKVLKRLHGVEGIAVYRAAVYGFVEIPVLFGQRGDLMLIDLAADYTPVAPDKAKLQALGINSGRNSLFPGPHGLIDIPTNLCRRAWRIA